MKNNEIVDSAGNWKNWKKRVGRERRKNRRREKVRAAAAKAAVARVIRAIRGRTRDEERRRGSRKIVENRWTIWRQSRNHWSERKKRKKEKTGEKIIVRNGDTMINTRSTETRKKTIGKRLKTGEIRENEDPMIRTTRDAGIDTTKGTGTRKFSFLRRRSIHVYKYFRFFKLMFYYLYNTLSLSSNM